MTIAVTEPGTTTVTSAFRGRLGADDAFRAHFRVSGVTMEEEPWRTS